VAHDLRTPLQAFQSELELLHVNIKDESLNDKSSLLVSITQLERICSFMNMTINRSIDFTKASSGIKLNPSIESTNLSETLNWAVGCMMTSDKNVPIVTLPISDDIGNQIYTDKQWLMENLLCLLSNAQKFTTEGNITIRCSLHSSVFQHTVVQKSKLFMTDTQVAKIETSDSSISLDKIEIANMDNIETANSMLLVEVEDTGIGIFSESQELLFKPFVQVPIDLLLCFRELVNLIVLAFN
jgi:signal transduction histidine kinase